MTFLLFAYEEYYPEGGFGDFKGAFTTIDDAVDRARSFKFCKDVECNGPDAIYSGYWHVVDTESLKIVIEGEYDCHLYEKDKDVEFVIWEKENE